MDSGPTKHRGRPPGPHLGEEVQKVNLHPHALERLAERGATVEEVQATVLGGESFPAKFGRTGFWRNFPFDSIWRDRHYTMKQGDVFAVSEGDDWLVMTVLTRYH